MSFFRRKHESEDARDERLSARPDRDAEERETAPEPEPEPEDARPEEERSPSAIVAPVAGEIVSGLADVRTLPDEAVSVPSLLEWSADGTSWRRAAAQERAEEAKEGLLHWDTASLDDGSYLLRLVAVLPAGAEIAGEPVPVLVDNLGPDIRLREPLEGRKLSGFVTIEVEAEDAVSDVSLVELEISGAGDDWRRVAEARRQPFELRWSSKALSDGHYRLRIRARDGSGNVGLLGPLEVEIVNAPAAAELVDPGELLRGRINLIARAPDPRSTQMIFELAKAGSSDWSALGTTRAPFHLPIDTNQVADGSYELRIESVTVEGKSVYSRRFGPYIVDNTPPTITIAKPAQGDTLRDRAELVVEVADEVSGPALVELSYNDGDKWMSLAGLEPEGGKVRGYWQVTECRPGDCRLRATAFDRAGNEVSEEITVTIAGPPPSKPEHAAEPESIVPSQPRAVVPVRPPSVAAAGRFGQVPSWDWKQHYSSGAEQTGEPANRPPDDEKPPPPSGAPGSPIGAEAEPAGAAEPKQAVKKGAAWTWKASPPRSDSPPSEQEPEEESPGLPKAEKEPPSEPERKTEEKHESQPEPEPESGPEGEPEEQVEPIEEKPVRAVHLVESAPSEALAETAPERESAPDSSAQEGGSVVKVDFARSGRGWDIWALSQLVEETPGQDPAREEERRQILYHLREHTTVDGRIPPEFEDLVLETFGDLIRDESDR
jgi:hypothetical protein